MIGTIAYGEHQGDLDIGKLNTWYRDCSVADRSCDHGFSRVQIQSEAGLIFSGQSTHTGTNTATFTNSPCAPGNPQEWLAIRINDAPFYIPACHP